MEFVLWISPEFKLYIIQDYKRLKSDEDSRLSLGLTWPMPMNLIRDFASKVEKLYVIEELEPFMETEIKAAGIQCTGKEYGSARWGNRKDIEHWFEVYLSSQLF